MVRLNETAWKEKWNDYANQITTRKRKSSYKNEMQMWGEIALSNAWLKSINSISEWINAFQIDLFMILNEFLNNVFIVCSMLFL